MTFISLSVGELQEIWGQRINIVCSRVVMLGHFDLSSEDRFDKRLEAEKVIIGLL